MKRGQISVFMIVSIVLLIILFIGFVALHAREKEISLPPTESMRIFVESCLENALFESSEEVARLGGFAEGDLPVYFDGQAHVPTLEFIAGQIAEASEVSIQSCLADFSIFTEQGWIVNAEKPEVTIWINDDLQASLLQPIIIGTETQSSQLSSFSASISTTIPLYYELSNRIISQHEKDPLYFPTSFLLELADENNIYIDIFQSGNRMYYHLYPLVGDIPDFSSLQYSFIIEYRWDQ